MSYQALGDYESAIKFLRDALRMRKNSLGDHQETARSFHGLGKVNLRSDINEFLFHPLVDHVGILSIGLG